MYTYYEKGSVERVKYLPSHLSRVQIPKHTTPREENLDIWTSSHHIPAITDRVGDRQFFCGHADYLVQRHSGTLAKFLKTTQDTRPRPKHPRPAEDMTGSARVKEGKGRGKKRLKSVKWNRHEQQKMKTKYLRFVCTTHHRTHQSGFHPWTSIIFT